MTDYKYIISKYKDVPGGIIEAFHAIQKELNYLPEDAIMEAAEIFDVPVKDAYGVATFYSYLSIKPRGKYIIRMCESAPCHVAGADQILAALENELGIKAGETTNDGRFTLELTECVGHCDEAPVITVNGKPHGRLTVDQIPNILANYR